MSDEKDKLTEIQQQIAETNTAEANRHTSHPITTQTEPAPQPVTDWQRLATQRQDEIDRLNAVIAAGKLAPSAPHPQRDARPGVTAAELRAKVGPVAWHKMSETEKIVGLGQNPSEIDRDFLKKVFGRGSDGRVALDLEKTSPPRYKVLR